MKKSLFAIFCLLSITLTLQAEGNLALRNARVIKKSEAISSRVLRIFKSDGSTVDYSTNSIDSITADDIAQRIWKDGTCQSIAIEEIDSVWYINPSLAISTPLVDFGKVSLGVTKSMAICIINTGEFPETFKLSNESSFVVDGVESGDITLEPGKARNIWISYAPSSLTKTEGLFTVHSSALCDGLRTISVCGEGVATEEEEEEADVVTYETVKVELPEGTDESFISKLELRNAYGRFPISPISERSAKPSKSYGPGSVAEFTGVPSSANGMMLNIVFSDDDPFLFQIRVPGSEYQPLSPRSTVLAMLMSEPVLSTDDPAEYQNLVNVITKDPVISERFEEQVKIAERLFEAHPNQCPDLSELNLNRVIGAMIHKFKSNEHTTINGLSLKDIDRYKDSIAYKVVNDHQRSVLIFPKRVYVDANNLSIKSEEDALWTIEDLLDLVDEKCGFAEKLIASEVRESLVDSLENEIQIPLPYIFNTGHASYWKIVADALTGDTDESLYRTESELYETYVKDCDKLFLDIYGIGYDKDYKFFNSASEADKNKYIAAVLYSIYKDAFMPVYKICGGISKIKKLSGPADNFSYDFRYGARNYPELALITKLWKNCKVKDIMKVLRKFNSDGFIAALEETANLIYGEILKSPKSVESGKDDKEKEDLKRPYLNLLYNMYKKETGISSNDAAALAKLKEAFNNITTLWRKYLIIGKTIDIAEYGVDLIGYAQAFQKSAPQTTFVINRKEEGLNVTNPSERDGYAASATSDGIINLEWDWYRGDNFGDILYDNFSFTIKIYSETSNDYYEYEVPMDIAGNKAAVDIKPVPGINRATRLWYKIIVHHKDNKDMIYDQTEMYPIYTSAPSSDKYIDLGLPSGTLWAFSNLGTTDYKQAGDYFAWGETTGYLNGKNSFSWTNYKHCKGAHNKLTKYVTKSEYSYYGSTDDKSVLDDDDDPAHAALGYMYRTPTSAEWKELMDECSWSAMDNGVLVRGKNGNVIFLPKAGYREGVTKYDDGTCGYYWTTDLDRNSPDDAWFTYFGAGNREKLAYYRSLGRSVRPIFHMVLPDKETPAQTRAPQKPNADKGGIYVERQLEDNNVVKTSCRTMIESAK